MNAPTRRLQPAIFALAALIGAYPQSGRSAELVVIESTDSDHVPGAIIETGESVRIAEGAEITVIASTGQLLELSGPYQGVPRISAAPSDPGLAESLSRLIVTEGKARESLAVFRSGPGRIPDGRPDIWGIDISKPGRHCVRDDSTAMMWWARARGGARVSLSKADDDAQRVDLRWPSTGRSRPWPPKLPIASGASYRVRFKSRSPGNLIDIVSMPVLPTDAHRAAWMADHGCIRQALRVLDALREGSL